MQSLKEYWQGLSDRTRRLLITIIASTAVITVAAIVGMNLWVRSNYSVLFTGLSQEEAQEVSALLQASEIDFRYNGPSGSIRVPTSQVNQTRAELLSEGYPKTGFTYDMYLTNAGILTTESDKKRLDKFDLQDRLGQQIALFDGIESARVTIVEASEPRYASGDETSQDASASVVVTMRNERVLSENGAAAIKNLIAKAVRGMTFTDVAVFDAGTSAEIGKSDEDGTFGSASALSSLTALVESNYSLKVRRLLEDHYGAGKVHVEANATLNMEKLIEESTLYQDPNRINDEDDIGYLERQQNSVESSGSEAAPAGGVVGADANADPERYVTLPDGTTVPNDAYYNSTAVNEYIYNLIKQQRQVDPGVVDQVSLAILIDTDNLTSIPQADLIRLVATATGIDRTVEEDRITIIRQANIKVVETIVPPPPPPDPDTNWVLIIAAISGGVLLLLLLLLLLLARGRRKRRKQQEAADLLVGTGDAEAFPGRAEDGARSPRSEAGLAAQRQLDDEMEQNEEIINLRMQHNLKLKQNIGEFVDQNPQIAAKLVQTWLRGKE